MHKASVTACVRVVPGKGGGPHRHEVRELATTTRGLLQLRDWLASFEVELVGMEATGIYQKPVYYLLVEGHFCNHHALVVGMILAHVDYLDGSIAELSAEAERVNFAPFSDKVELLDTIPGVDRRTAEVLIAEIGAGMDQFPTHRHLA